MDPIKDVIPSEDVRPLASQVAGHTREKDKSPGMLKHKDGYVLKPLLKSDHAKTEIEFYHGLASASYAGLMSFIPKFYGTAQISMEMYKGEVLILEDITGGLEEPCIMDIKIGRQTWDPYATTTKIESEKRKYTQCKREFGFCIPGFQVYDSDTGKLTRFDKSYGKSLDRNTLPEALSKFFNLGKQRSGEKVIAEYIRQLQKIEDIISLQRTLHLYSSSILLKYDCTQLGSNSDVLEWAHVHMIDFAHTFTSSSHEQGSDRNYLDGLRGLINVLQTLRR